VAFVAGVLLGVGDLLLQRNLPYPWANLANSSAVWAVAAFALGRWLRRDWRRSGVAGVTMLVVAVEAYYAAAVVLLNDSTQNLWATSTLLWLGFGVLAGLVFGVAGGVSRGERRWPRIISSALPGAVLLAEASILAGRGAGAQHGSDYRADSLQTAAIEAALGVVLLVLMGRATSSRVPVFAGGVVLAAIGFGAFAAAGFGG